MDQNIKREKIVLWFLLSIVIVAGLYFRLKGLGKWPLALDEYYLVKSSENIIKHGLPMWDLGGYYSRGIIQQYITALLLLAGIKMELASRIIPLVANICSIPVLYIFAKKLSGKVFAVFIIFVFTFSVWEVEFARFARMYALFQTIFIYYLYFYYKLLIDKDEKSWKWIFILSGISIFIYEASIFLTFLNFLPLFWNYDSQRFEITRNVKSNLKIRRILWAVAVFILCYLFNSIDFRRLGQTNLFPENYVSPASSTTIVRTPLILFSYTFSNPLWILLSILLLVLNLYFIYKTLIDKDKIGYKIFSLFVILFSFLNLFGLILYTLILFLLLRWIIPDQLKRGYIVLLPVILNFILWSAFGILNASWHKYFPYTEFGGAFSSLKILWKEFINYPYFYETLVLFRDTLPRLTVVVIVLLAAGITQSIFYREKEQNYRILYAIFLILLLMIDVLNLTYFDTRYFLFLYPLVIILTYLPVKRLADQFRVGFNLKLGMFATVSLLILLVSEDFNLKHLEKIDSYEINFRTNFSLAQKIHFYPRWDTRSPAEFVNKNVKDSDIVIINEQVNDIYLNKLDYIYRNEKGTDFLGESVDKGKKERWTDAGLIYTDKQFINLLENNSYRKWLIINTLWGKELMKENNFWGEFTKYAVYANKDSSAIVYEIPGKDKLKD